MIIIDENYAIETDGMGNFSLFRRKVTKTGKNAGEEKRDYVGHYSTLKGAVSRYVTDKFNSETESSEILLADAIDRLENIEKRILDRIRF